jgi:hypothetical protein
MELSSAGGMITTCEVEALRGKPLGRQTGDMLSSWPVVAPLCAFVMRVGRRRQQRFIIINTYVNR